MQSKSLRYMSGLSEVPVCEQVALVANVRQQITAEAAAILNPKILEIILQTQANVYIGGDDVLSNGGAGGDYFNVGGDGKAFNIDKATDFSVYVISDANVNISVNRYR